MQVLHGQLMRGFITFSLGAIATSALAQGPAPRGRPTLATGVRQFVVVDTSSVALTHVRVIDGTGAAPRADQTILVESGRIAAIGDAGQVRVPPNAQVLDMTGKSVIPGLVMVHEHLFYPTGPGAYAYLDESFTRLYLAGGVTSMRTGGDMNGFGDLGIKRAIDRGEYALFACQRIVQPQVHMTALARWPGVSLGFEQRRPQPACEASE